MTQSILLTGLAAGILDAVAAVAQYMIRGGRTPARIFNFIASGVFGPAAMTGGAPMVVAGVLFHLLIAIGWTTLFYLAARQFDVLRRHYVGAAVAYGVFVWIMMNKAVLPLSRVQMGPGGSWTQVAIGVLILIVCIGFPVAIGARRYFSRPAAR